MSVGRTPDGTEDKGTPLTPLLQRLVRKRDLLRAGDPAHETIRTGLLADGGSMRGVFTGGVVTALEDMGMTEVFDYTVGVSAGAAGIAYFLTGNSRRGTSIYYEDLTGKEFINWWRAVGLINPLGKPKILNLDHLFEVIRKVKPLDLEQLQRIRTHLFVAVTNADSGKCEILDTRQPGLDVMAAFQASAALPVAYNQIISVHGVDYCDGALGCGLPVRYLVDNLRCTDILVIMNSPFGERGGTESLVQRVLTRLQLPRLPEAVQVAFRGRDATYNEGVALVRTLSGEGHAVRIGVISPPGPTVSRLCRDPQLLKEVADRAEQQVLEEFRIAESVASQPTHPPVESPVQS